MTSHVLDRLLVSVVLGATCCGASVGWAAEPATAAAPASAPAATASAKAAPDAKAPLPWAATRRHGLEQPKARTPGALRIASYNIENLFDDKDDPKLTGSGDDKNMLKDSADRANAALAIRLIDADVVALQEVESLEAVKWFRDEFLKDMGYEYVESLDAGDGRGIEQAVMSRFPLSGAKVWPEQELGATHPRRRNAEAGAEAGKPIMLRRSPFLVNVKVPAGSLKGADGKGMEKDYEFTMMVLHHKSGRPNGYWRDAEAKKFVQWAKELQAAKPELNLMICGDFNARAGDDSMQTYFDAGFEDSFIAAGVKQPRPARTAPKNEGGAERGGRGDDESDGPLDPSVISHASEQTIDFVLMNAGMLKELIKDSAFVLGTGARMKGADWRNTPKPAGWASDHYPLVVDVMPMDK